MLKLSVHQVVQKLSHELIEHQVVHSTPEVIISARNRGDIYTAHQGTSPHLVKMILRLEMGFVTTGMTPFTHSP